MREKQINRTYQSYTSFLLRSVSQMHHVVAVKAKEIVGCTDRDAMSSTKNKKEMVGPSSRQYSIMFWILSYIFRKILATLECLFERVESSERN